MKKPILFIIAFVLITTFLCGQNAYPNPFTRTTTFSFDIPKNPTSQVELSIYNIKGQLVRDLKPESKFSGTCSVIWDGKDKDGKSVPDGIYFYKMKGGSFTSTKKVILIK